MKHKVKRYQEGGVLTDRFGNPVRSGSGKPVRTRSADEIAEDMKRPMGGSSQATRSITPIKEETLIQERSTKSPSVIAEELGQGPMDYATLGKRAGASSPFSGPKEYISESLKEDIETASESPRGIASGFKSGESKFERKDNEVIEKKKVVKKAAAKKPSQEFPTRDRDRADQSFPLKTDDKKVPPLRKIGEAIMGTMERKSMPYSSSMYDKMKGRKAGGSVKMASGGKVSSASSRGDGIAQRGKTRGRIC